MWLMGSKPVRSYVTRQRHLCRAIVSSQIHEDGRVFDAQMTSCALRYDVIYHPFPINSQYLNTSGVDSPESALYAKEFLIKCLLWASTAPIINKCTEYSNRNLMTTIGTLRSNEATQWERCLKSEFTFFQSLSQLFLPTYFVKCRRAVLELNS